MYRGLSYSDLQGQYNHILRSIFLYLDGTSLHCAELVCWTWRRFVTEEIWENVECRAKLSTGWRSGIPATRRLELRTNTVAMKVDERSIVCGLEDGRVDLYSRASLERTGLVSGHRENITSLAMDCRLIVTGGGEGGVRLWCRQSATSLGILSPHTAPVTAVHLDTPVDVKGGLVRQHVFSASRDGTIRRLGLVASQEEDKMRLVREPLVEDFCLQCENPVTAMTLDHHRILAGLNNAKVGGI